MNEETLSNNDKIIKLPADVAEQLWFDLQWEEDKVAILENRKKLNDLCKFVGINV
jgi:hypothetical protein